MKYVKLQSLTFNQYTHNKITKMSHIFEILLGDIYPILPTPFRQTGFESCLASSS